MMLLVAAATVAESISWQVKLESRIVYARRHQFGRNPSPTDPAFSPAQSGIPDEAERALLQELGVEPVQYISPDNTWVCVSA